MRQRQEVPEPRIRPVHLPDMQNFSAARVSAGVSTGGQFAHRARTEPSVGLDERTTTARSDALQVREAVTRFMIEEPMSRPRRLWLADRLMQHDEVMAYVDLSETPSAALLESATERLQAAFDEATRRATEITVAEIDAAHGTEREERLNTRVEEALALTEAGQRPSLIDFEVFDEHAVVLTRQARQQHERLVEAERTLARVRAAISEAVETAEAAPVKGLPATRRRRRVEAVATARAVHDQALTRAGDEALAARIEHERVAQALALHDDRVESARKALR